MKPNFKRKQKRRVHGATFWDAEYTNPRHLKLSETESSDLAKFMRWVARQDRDGDHVVLVDGLRDGHLKKCPVVLESLFLLPAHEPHKSS